RTLLYDCYRPIQPSHIASIISNAIELPVFIDVCSVKLPDDFGSIAYIGPDRLRPVFPSQFLKSLGVSANGINRQPHLT
ncbi:hypothetical protein ACC689_35665, partial [Rhizobium ruizarguesonis]